MYTFTTPKLQPLVTKAEGKNLIQVRIARLRRRQFLVRLTLFLGLSERARALSRQREWRRRFQPSRIARRTSQFAPAASDEPTGHAISYASELRAERTYGPSTGYGVSELHAAPATRQLWAAAAVGYAAAYFAPIVIVAILATNKCLAPDTPNLMH